MRKIFYVLMVIFLMFGCKRQEDAEKVSKLDLAEKVGQEVEKVQGLEEVGDASQVGKGGEHLCKKHGDCDEGFYCDSLSGYKCKKRCVPDNGEFYTVSKDCVGTDRICRADGRCSSKYFETVWRIDKSDPVLVLPAVGSSEGSPCDAEIDWGDGEVSKVEVCDSDLRHEYKDLGEDEVHVRISGVYDGWWMGQLIDGIFQAHESAKKLVEVVSFGGVGFSSFKEVGAFAGCVNLRKVALDDVPDSSKFLSADNMFWGAKDFNGSIGHWDVSNVESMDAMFQGAESFNQSLEGWDVSGVSDMQAMFKDAKSFNQSLESWDVSGVQSMREMFHGAEKFNQLLKSWDVSGVKDVVGIFEGSGLEEDNACSMVAGDGWKGLGWQLGLDYGCTKLDDFDVGVQAEGSKEGEKCRRHSDCGEGEICDSLSGFVCKKRCVPDSGEYNTVSKDCVGADSICRADGRCSSKYFVSVWRVDRMFPEVSLLHDGVGVCDFEVDWGDGVVERIVGCEAAKLKHRYKNVTKKGKEVVVKISGRYEGWGESPDAMGVYVDIPKREGGGVRVIRKCSNLLRIESFGPVKFSYQNDFGAFVNCEILEELALKDVPDASRFWRLSYAFFGAYRFNGSINHWDVSQVQDMSYAFYNAKLFNQSLESWDVSKVQSMAGMFYMADSFNQPLESWDVSRVRDMRQMFLDAFRFNQPLGSWDVSQVRDMMGMFSGAEAFNQALEGWNVSRVRDMGMMFSGAVSFNQALEGWKVSQVHNMREMFSGAVSFNQALGRWDVSQVGDMGMMFSGAVFFNQALEGWDVSRVHNMREMFHRAGSFNQALEGWNVSRVRDMAWMFHSAAAFNQALGKWDVSAVNDMSWMFSGAKSFDQDLGDWQVKSSVFMDNIFRGSGLGKEHYCKMMQGSWKEFFENMGIKYSCE